PAGATTSPSPAATLADRPALAAMSAERGRSRDNPVEVMIHSRTRLNKPGSGKETWHLEFDLNESGLDYTVGDTFGIYPTNDLALVDAVIKAIDAPPDFPIGGVRVAGVVVEGVWLRLPPEVLLEVNAHSTDLICL